MNVVHAARLANATVNVCTCAIYLYWLVQSSVIGPENYLHTCNCKSAKQKNKSDYGSNTPLQLPKTLMSTTRLRRSDEGTAHRESRSVRSIRVTSTNAPIYICTYVCMVCIFV